LNFNNLILLEALMPVSQPTAKQCEIFGDPLYRDLLVREKTRMRVAYDLLADTRNLSVTKDVREVVGQDDPELEAACKWLLRRMNAIETALGRPTCLDCGCGLDAIGFACTVCQWSRG
jgi:hypothetical protein